MAARTDSQAQAHVPIHPRLLVELHEIFGLLHDFEQVSAKLLAVQIGSRNVFLPTTFQAQLKELKGQRIAATLIKGKYYVRLLKGNAAGVVVK